MTEKFIEKIDLMPWAEWVVLPDNLRDNILRAVNHLTRVDPVTQKPAHRLRKEDADGFIAAIEQAVFQYLAVRGLWARGPNGYVPSPVAREGKPHPTRSDFAKPLKKIAASLEEIERQLSLLPSEGIERIEHASSAYLIQHGVHDAYLPIDVIAEDNGGSGHNCIKDPFRRYRFLLRLHALRHGVRHAQEWAMVQYPAQKPTDFTTKYLVETIAHAFEVHLGHKPVPGSVEGHITSPFVKALEIVFDWLNNEYGIKAPGRHRLTKLAQEAI